MSATNAVLFSRSVTSAVATQQNGDRICTSGFPVTVQIVAPTAEGRIEVSNDGTTWTAATYNAGTAATGLATGMYAIDGNSYWVRPSTRTDAAGPAVFEYLFSVYKES